MKIKDKRAFTSTHFNEIDAGELFCFPDNRCIIYMKLGYYNPNELEVNMVALDSGEVDYCKGGTEIIPVSGEVYITNYEEG